MTMSPQAAGILTDAEVAAAPIPQSGVSPEEANFNVELLIRMDRLDARLDELQKLTGHTYQCLGSHTNRMDKLDARLASLENVYADVRRAQNHLESLPPLRTSPEAPA